MSDDTAADLHSEIRSVLTDVVEKGPEEVSASWKACAGAGLLALAAPTDHGGEGMGLGELAVLVREAGARALDLPLRETLVCGLLTLARSGTPEQQETFIPAIVAGDLLVAPALNEVGTALPHRPTTRVEDDRLTGRKVAVPVFDDLPDATTVLLVSATDARGEAVVVLADPRSDGVTQTTTPTSRGTTEATYVFEGAPVLGVLADGAADVLRRHAVAGLLLQGDGLLAGARELTAGYVKERTQFGRKLAEFQGVAIQLADVYVVSRMVALAAEEVTRRVVADEPVADDLGVGSFWFCDRAPAALQTCHHLHGGMGVDETYPLHRYFAGVKDVARLLGGAEAALAAVPPGEPTEAANAELTADQRAFKDEVRTYFAGLVSPDDRMQMMRDRHGEAYHRTIRQMGDDGWMGVGWPVEYGGKGLGGIEQQIFANEAARADVHLPSVTLQTVGPTLQAFGTEKQKDLFLKRILAGDVHFAIGYSEADA
ncbi:MAG: acyl-CoA dehydrogenase, partial [Marmoricola sp.]